MIDSNILIANVYDKDQYHLQAKKILKEFSETRQYTYITDYILLETVNFLTKKSDRQQVTKAMEALLNSNKIQVISNNRETFLETAKEFKNYRTLSFTDVNIVIQMRRNSLKELLSFDSGFDEVKEIKRIH